MDVREVSLCSTIHPVYSGDTVERWSKTGDGPQQKISVPRPTSVTEYNKYMGGVDTSDQMIGTNSVHRKTRRWPTTVFQQHHLIMVRRIDPLGCRLCLLDDVDYQPLPSWPFNPEQFKLSRATALRSPFSRLQLKGSRLSIHSVGSRRNLSYWLKWIKQGPLESCFGFFLACSTPANCGRIWSCRHWNFPSGRLDRHEERTCSKLACLPQSQLGLSANPHGWRFDGVGRTSYTEHSRNLIRCPSMLQMFCQTDLPLPTPAWISPASPALPLAWISPASPA
ncbi:hypothetical protein N1851_009334 [Merluccius polli]|uniref:PiggyBac transposable element-derived protein domain-containing protein n=1 Tax=Merluccius polli TaxID=89951 RepID=A0AA47P828_MERPO|nr:hypothetical protein N1851_009334 [Merluccius polli]